MYVLRTGLGHEENNIALICRDVNKNNIWHVRLGHLSNQRLVVMKQQHPCIQYNMNDCCDVCHKAKQKRLPFPESFSHASNAFDLIHTDILGPCSTASLNGERYFFTIVDDNTRFTWIFLMKSKAKTRTHIINFVHYVKTQFGRSVKVMQSDNGIEFDMKSFFQNEGIVHQTSCVETPQQNGIAKRKHQHIMNVTRAILFQSKLSMQFWSYVVTYVVFVINCVPTPFLKNTSPFERLYNKIFDINLIRVFGCLCFLSTKTANRKKLDARADVGIFLGLQSNVKGYII